jgi:hypothetical protein
VSLRALRFLLPILAIMASRTPVRAPEPVESQVVAARASTSAPAESAESESHSRPSVVAADSRAAHRASRPTDPTALPTLARAFARARQAHERTGGLDLAPVETRELGFPFYATAPPRDA